MPKAYITQKSSDIIYLRAFYKKLIKLTIILYIILFIHLAYTIQYNFTINNNDYFIVTTTGQLLQIFPQQ